MDHGNNQTRSAIPQAAWCQLNRARIRRLLGFDVGRLESNELDVHATASNLRAAASEHAATRTFIDARLCKVGHIAEQIVELGLQAAGQGRCRSAGRTDRKCRQQQSLLEGEFFH